MASFSHAGHRLAYTDYGGGAAGGAPVARAPGDARAGRPLILVHGLLLAQTMHEPLARALGERGNRSITIDLLGHGRSDRPRDMTRYSMRLFGEQVLALMDHLELEQAAVLGTSLGANTALEFAALAPDRVRGLVIEMPVLDHALAACAAVFSPLLVALTYGEPLAVWASRAARAVPRRALPYYANVALDTVRQQPGPGGAVLQGLFASRFAPPAAERRALTAPALVLGHRRDPVHPFSDAGMLASEMPNAELLEASSLLELRLRPARITAAIADFLDRVWATPEPRAVPAGAPRQRRQPPLRSP